MAQLEQYLIDSTLLDSPVTSNDPTFAQVKSCANQIITETLQEKGYTASTLPYSYQEYVLLLAKKEVYFRLATLTAPEFNMETEFSKLLQGDRWQHYYKLLELTIKEISRIEEESSFNTITTGEVIISGRNGSYRNYRLAEDFDGSLEISSITSNSANLTWDKFYNSEFAGYKIYLSKSPIYDEFDELEIDSATIESSFIITDVHKTKLRINGLNSNTLYYLVFIYQHVNGYKDIISMTFTTLDVI